MSSILYPFGVLLKIILILPFLTRKKSELPDNFLISKLDKSPALIFSIIKYACSLSSAENFRNTLRILSMRFFQIFQHL